MKKKFKIFCLTIILFIAIVFLLNISDSKLTPEAQEILQTSLTSTVPEENQCALILGLFIDENLDFEVEGRKLLTQIQSIPIESLNEKNEVKIPTFRNVIQEKEKCEGVCDYGKDEKDRLKNELLRQTIFLTRFKKVIEGHSFSCLHPFLLLKFPMLNFFHISRHQIMEYKILAQEGKVKESQEGLIKMNAFFENTLLNERKYTLIAGLIFVKILNHTREVLSALPTFNHATIKFKAISYENTIKPIEIGELQAKNVLFSSSMARNYFDQTTLLSDTHKIKKYFPLVQLFDRMINMSLNYFFLKNEILNENLQFLRLAAWHPCIGQEDIACEIKSPNMFAWLRNPMGKLTVQKSTSNTINYFRKLKNNIDELTITTYHSVLRKK